MPDDVRLDDFLDRLSGSWALTGTMGSTELHQSVEARWVLDGHFLQMHLLQEDTPAAGRQPYEALYLLGYDTESDEYVMHLFDTFGASYARTVGIGTRRGNSVEFLFEYPGALFSNTFTWLPESGQWTMHLREKQETGGWKEFATKKMSPR
jgi:hypothetical protein